ncbi:MAG: hypothetical protein MUC99_07770 [Anaerolineae bacterium]|jgi:hypothetical protein|nr:hypothetical protein [Anaerolineae bacterium]
MAGFVIFIFGAVIVGAGAMLSPAYPTRQPRIGVAAALALALVMGGAVFYGTAFGWNTLVVDYMLFVLVVGIFLGGTLSYGQKRAEARGEELLDEDQGWPGLWDLVGLLGAFLAFALVFALVQPAPADLWAQSAEQIRAGAGLYAVPVAPAAPVLTAYLSTQLGESAAVTLGAVAVVVAGVMAWVGYDLGAEVRDKQLGRLVALACAGVALVLLLGGQTGLLMACLWLLVLGFATVRYIRTPERIDLLAAGLMVGAAGLALPVAAVVGVGVLGWGAYRARSPRFALIGLAIALIATLPTVWTSLT